MPEFCEARLRSPWPFGKIIVETSWSSKTAIKHPLEFWSWLSTWLYLKLTKSRSSGHMCEGFCLVGLFEVEATLLWVIWGLKTHSNSGFYLAEAHIKDKEDRSFCLLLACPHSHWKIHLSCSFRNPYGYGDILGSLVLGSYGFQCSVMHSILLRGTYHISSMANSARCLINSPVSRLINKSKSYIPDC